MSKLEVLSSIPKKNKNKHPTVLNTIIQIYLKYCRGQAEIHAWSVQFANKTEDKIQ